MKLERSSTLLVFVAGCAMLGGESDFAGPVSTSGAGPFRLVSAEETGLGTSPAIVETGDHAARSGRPIGGFLFYASAAPLPDPPERSPELAGHEIDLDRFEALSILRATSNGLAGYEAGQVVLEAAAPWEGAAVFDPWPIEVEGGGIRVYYAAEGGIGAAEASSVDGALVRVGDGRILGPLPDGRIPSSPSVLVDDEFGTLLYFDAEGEIGLARSSDGGSTFQLVDADPTTALWDALDLSAPPPSEGDPIESKLGHPGAIVGSMGSGRRTLRLYFEVHRDDETRTVAFAASLDGTSFERSTAAIVGGSQPGNPVPIFEDRGRMRLYVSVASPGSGEQRRLLRLAVPEDETLPTRE